MLKRGISQPYVRRTRQGHVRARVGYQASEKVMFLAEMPLNEGKVNRATRRDA